MDKCKTCKFSRFSINGDIFCKVLDKRVFSENDCPLLHPKCELCHIYDSCAGSVFVCKGYMLKEIEDEDNWYDK